MLSYASNDPDQVVLIGNGQLPGGVSGEEANLEFRAEHTFENGAVYKGQWLGDARHGFGV